MKAEAERKDKMWEDATVKNLEAVTELIEALAPFHLHGLALRWTVLPDNATINKVGSSYLVKGAFETAIEAVQKWQDLLEDSNDHAHTCTPLGAHDCPHCGNCKVCNPLKRKDECGPGPCCKHKDAVDGPCCLHKNVAGGNVKTGSCVEPVPPVAEKRNDEKPRICEDCGKNDGTVTRACFKAGRLYLCHDCDR
jgi:hypothetical protein